IVMVAELLAPLWSPSQPVKRQPSLAVAEIFRESPSLYWPPSGVTLPPSEGTALMDTWYLVVESVEPQLYRINIPVSIAAKANSFFIVSVDDLGLVIAGV